MTTTTKLLGALCWGLLVQQLSGQTLCTSPQSSVNLDINNIKARISNFDLPSNQNLAPFIDADLDGIYNPLAGDYPAVELQGKTPFVSDQILWCVFNDVGAPHSLSGGTSIGMEIQLTSWAFATPSGAPFSNTHKQEEASVVRLPPQLFIIHPTF